MGHQYTYLTKDKMSLCTLLVIVVVFPLLFLVHPITCGANYKRGSTYPHHAEFGSVLIGSWENIKVGDLSKDVNSSCRRSSVDWVCHPAKPNRGSDAWGQNSALVACEKFRFTRRIKFSFESNSLPSELRVLFQKNFHFFMVLFLKGFGSLTVGFDNIVVIWNRFSDTTSSKYTAPDAHFKRWSFPAIVNRDFSIGIFKFILGFSPALSPYVNDSYPRTLIQSHGILSSLDGIAGSFCRPFLCFRLCLHLIQSFFERVFAIINGAAGQKCLIACDPGIDSSRDKGEKCNNRKHYLYGELAIIAGALVCAVLLLVFAVPR